MSLTPREINAAYRLEKHGRLVENEPGYFGAPESFATTPAFIIRKLAQIGICRIDKVGDAIFMRVPTAEERIKK